MVACVNFPLVIEFLHDDDVFLSKTIGVRHLHFTSKEPPRGEIRQKSFGIFLPRDRIPKKGSI
jgi:hypothetical protein